MAKNPFAGNKAPPFGKKGAKGAPPKGGKPNPFATKGGKPNPFVKKGGRGQ